MDDGILIGELAKKVGVSTKTIRYYEEFGLLATAKRLESGYRLYDDADIDRIRFIQGAKALGLSLTEIKEIVDIWKDGVRPCGHVTQLLEEKLADLDRRIHDLTHFRNELRRYKDQVEAIEAGPDVPCAHIAGVMTGQWPPPSAESPSDSRPKQD